LFFGALTQPDKEAPYNRLNEDLLLRRTLTKDQRIKQLYAVNGLGSCRPTQLPTNAAGGWQLEADEHYDIRQLLAVKADRLLTQAGGAQSRRWRVRRTRVEGKTVNAVQTDHRHCVEA
jgi:hypothetical protein